MKCETAPFGRSSSLRRLGAATSSACSTPNGKTLLRNGGSYFATVEQSAESDAWNFHETPTEIGQCGNESDRHGGDADGRRDHRNAWICRPDEPAYRNGRQRSLSLLVRVHPLVERDLSRLRQLPATGYADLEARGRLGP